MITNPAPPTVGTFNQWWITNCTIILSSSEPVVRAIFAPYDGTHLLASGLVNISEFVPPTNTAFAEALTNMKAVIATLSGQSAAPCVLQVFASDPTKPVIAQAMFQQPPAPGTPIPSYRIPDCYGLAGSNTNFATAFSALLGQIAALAGLTYTN